MAKTKGELQLALLEVAEGLKRELEFGLADFVPPTLAARIETLSSKCWDALENPSMADCDRIKATGAKPVA